MLGRRTEATLPTIDEELATRLAVLRGICFCLLYDLCCWMASAHEGVPEEIAEYSLTDHRENSDPVERLRGYVAGDLVDSWAASLAPFFERRLRLAPELGDTGPLREEGLEQGGQVRAEVRFHNRSVVVDDQERRHALGQEWILDIWVEPGLSRVVDARLRMGDV